MTKINRITYGALITIVGIPFALSVLVNDLPSTMRRLWPYFLAALVFLVVLSIYVELREREVGKEDADLGQVADLLAKSVYGQWKKEVDARRIDTPARLPVKWRVSEERPFSTREEVLRYAQGWKPESLLAELTAVPGDHRGEVRASALDELFSQIPTGRLVVLGKPGGGKTVLLVKLLLSILERQNRRAPWEERSRRDRVIPVFASLSAWNPPKVFAQLGTDSHVGKVLRTPLMLSLARAVYNWHPRGHESQPLPSPDALLDRGSPNEIRDDLLDAFVDAAYRDRPENAKAARRALSYLAAYLEEGGRDPFARASRRRSAAHRPEAPGFPRQGTERISFAWWDLRAVAGPVIGFTIGFPAAAVVAVVAAVGPGLGVGLGLGILAGFAVSTGAGMILGRSWHVPNSSDSVGVGIMCGFVGALLGAAPTGIILHITGHASALLPHLVGSFGVGIGPGVSGGLRRGIPAAAAGGVVCALTAGSATGWPAGVVDGVGVWLAVGLTVSATAGAAAGLEGLPADSTLAEAAASPALLLARDRGILRQVGGVYEFRHIDLQRRLASEYPRKLPKAVIEQKTTRR